MINESRQGRQAAAYDPTGNFSCSRCKSARLDIVNKGRDANVKERIDHVGGELSGSFIDAYAWYMGIPCSISRVTLEYLNKQSCHIEKDVGPDEDIDSDVHPAFGTEDSKI